MPHSQPRAAIESVRRAKAEGLAVTADTAPPYFLLNELAVSTYNTAFKLSPPLRSEDDRQAVIEGLADGTIDAVASDHMPVDRDAKTQPFGPAAPGASGVDTLLALTLTLVHQKHISLSRAIELLSIWRRNQGLTWHRNGRAWTNGRCRCDWVYQRHNLDCR